MVSKRSAMHFFDLENGRLLCEFVGTRVSWTLEPNSVECRECRHRLAARGEADTTWIEATKLWGEGGS